MVGGRQSRDYVKAQTADDWNRRSDAVQVAAVEGPKIDLSPTRPSANGISLSHSPGAVKAKSPGGGSDKATKPKKSGKERQLERRKKFNPQSEGFKPAKGTKETSALQQVVETRLRDWLSAGRGALRQSAGGLQLHAVHLAARQATQPGITRQNQRCPGQTRNKSTASDRGFAQQVGGSYRHNPTAEARPTAAACEFAVNTQIESTYQVTAEDIERENRMTLLLIRMDQVLDRELKRAIFAEYQQLHDQRTLGFIKHLELQKGLAQ